MSNDMKVDDGTTTIVALQSTGDDPGCSAVRLNSNMPFTVKDAVVTVGKRVISDTLDGYYVSDGSQTPYSGVFVVIPNTSGTNFEVGDKVEVEGARQEIFCQTQIIATKITKTGSASVPAPVALTGPLTATELEPWEGVVVSFSDVSVTGLELRHARTNAGVLIDKALYPELVLPADGSKLTRLTGVITYSDGAYRLSPRAADDLVLGTPDCTPQCDGRTCGDDGCGRTCGSCTGSERCEADNASARCVNKFAKTYPEGQLSIQTSGGSCVSALYTEVNDNGDVRLKGAATGTAPPRCEASFQNRPLSIVVQRTGDSAKDLKVNASGEISGEVGLQIEWAGAGASIIAEVAATISAEGRVSGSLSGLPKSVTLMGQNISVRGGTILP